VKSNLAFASALTPELDGNISGKTPQKNGAKSTYHIPHRILQKFNGSCLMKHCAGLVMAGSDIKV